LSQYVRKMQINYKLTEMLILVPNKSTVRPKTGLTNLFEGACLGNFQEQNKILEP